MFLSSVPNPFLLPPISASWWKTVAEYDPDLRVFPSQTKPIYRLGRVSKVKAMNWALFKADETTHPDTKIALTHHLVLVNWSLPATILTKPPEALLAVLKRRDLWTLGPNGADHAGRILEETEDEQQRKDDKAFREKTRDIGREARRSVQYRTGQRISLVSPRSPKVAAIRVTDRRRVVPATAAAE